MTAPLEVMSTLGLFGPLSTRIVPAYQARSGITLAVRYDPSGVLMAAIAAGNHPDVLLALDTALATLAEDGLVDTAAIVPIARSTVGLAIRPGEPRPDISTPAALVDTLRAARSIAFSRTGASGLFFAGLIERLGIAAEVRAKAVIVPAGFTAERLVAGEVDLAVQQLSELAAVPGVEIVGAFPEPHQVTSIFAAAPFAASTRPDEARNFIAALRTPDSAAAFAAAGLAPVTSPSCPAPP